MIIRRLGPGDDVAGAIALLQRFFREEGFDTPDAVIAANTKRMATIEVCLLLLAEDGGKAVGAATVSMEFGIEYGWWAELGDLYVVPEWRGRGLSRKLVAAAEAWLHEKGAAGYQVTVTPYAEDHHGLRQFYMALGFEDEGRKLLFKNLTAR